MSNADLGNKDNRGDWVIGRGNYLIGADSRGVYFYHQGDSLITLLRPLLFLLFCVYFWILYCSLERNLWGRKHETLLCFPILHPV